MKNLLLLLPILCLTACVEEADIPADQEVNNPNTSPAIPEMADYYGVWQVSCYSAGVDSWQLERKFDENNLYWERLQTFAGSTDCSTPVSYSDWELVGELESAGTLVGRDVFNVSRVMYEDTAINLAVSNIMLRRNGTAPDYFLNYLFDNTGSGDIAFNGPTSGGKIVLNGAYIGHANVSTHVLANTTWYADDCVYIDDDNSYREIIHISASDFVATGQIGFNSDVCELAERDFATPYIEQAQIQLVEVLFESASSVSLEHINWDADGTPYVTGDTSEFELTANTLTDASSGKSYSLTLN